MANVKKKKNNYKDFVLNYKGVDIVGRIYPSNQEWNYGNITLNFLGLCIEGISLRVNRNDEYWLAMPSRQIDGAYRNYVYFLADSELEELIITKAAEAAGLNE